MIEDFDSFESFISNILDTRFKDIPSERSLAFSHPIYTPKKTKEKLIELLFEKMDASEVYLGY